MQKDYTALHVDLFSKLSSNYDITFWKENQLCVFQTCVYRFVQTNSLKYVHYIIYIYIHTLCTYIDIYIHVYIHTYMHVHTCTYMYLHT